MDIVEIKNHQMLLAGSVSMDLVDEPTIDPGTIDAPPWAQTCLVRVACLAYLAWVLLTGNPIITKYQGIGE